MDGAYLGLREKGEISQWLRVVLYPGGNTFSPAPTQAGRVSPEGSPEGVLGFLEALRLLFVVTVKPTCDLDALLPAAELRVGATKKPK